MDTYKLGLCTLGIYILLAIASWAVVDGLPDKIISTVFLFVSIISIVLWYEAIKKAMGKSIKHGIIVSMFYIIPYGVITLATYKALFNNELRDVFKLIIWTIFTNPMRIIPSETSFIVFEPFIIIGLLALISIILNFLKYRKEIT